LVDKILEVFHFFNTTQRYFVLIEIDKEVVSKVDFELRVIDVK